MSNATIMVNGSLYDSETGLPVDMSKYREQQTTFASKKASSSHQMHNTLQKSHTLNRRTVKKQVVTAPVAAPATQPRSAMIAKFAPHPSGSLSTRRTISDIGPSVHPIVQKTEQRREAAKKVERPNPAMRPAAIIKQQAIEKALKNAPSHKGAKTVKTTRRTPRFLSFASAALALLLLGGYFAYINLPNISVRVAAAQAGIDASYPGYKPDGYRLATVNYDKGSVSLKFASNAGPKSYTITQQQTGWDSSAVKENYVAPKWGSDVVPYSEQGLTIYAHEGNAAWVNGGILYTISGDAPLSPSQVRGIATNL